MSVRIAVLRTGRLRVMGPCAFVQADRQASNLEMKHKERASMEKNKQAAASYRM